MSNHKTTWTVHADGNGVARHYDESMQEAIGVIDKYVQDGDAHRPHFEAIVETLAQQAIERGAKKPYDEIEWRARELLKARATNESTMYPAVEKTARSGATFYPAQPVYLDFDDVAGAKNRSWGLPVPAILFATLDPEKDRMYKAGECEAIAVYFDPDSAEEPRTITWDGQPESIASDWDPACYQGVVRTFASFTEMRRARRDLVRAIELVKAPVPTDAEPDWHEEIPDEDDVPFDGI